MDRAARHTALRDFPVSVTGARMRWASSLEARSPRPGCCVGPCGLATQFLPSLPLLCRRKSSRSRKSTVYLIAANPVSALRSQLAPARQCALRAAHFFDLFLAMTARRSFFSSTSCAAAIRLSSRLPGPSQNRRVPSRSPSDPCLPPGRRPSFPASGDFGWK
jgi:hypothetical protein